MSSSADSARGPVTSLTQHWDRFWFSPADPHTLAMMRILAGAMLFYTHFVWALDLEAFLGPTSWTSREFWELFHATPDDGMVHAWSYLWYLKTPHALWTAHALALLVFGMLTIGLFTRVVSILAWLITVAYCHRLTGSLFGLDQINAMLAMYLMIGPAAATYSVDQWWRNKRAGGNSVVQPSVAANISIRLLQLHMCIIYLFGGLAKMRGTDWWDGSATWYSIANLEYQSFDMTWLASYPILIALLTHVTVFWETFYCFLIWPRLTRPWMLAIAVSIHGSIAIFLGMMTFGLVMLIGNLAFVPPSVMKSAVEQSTGRLLQFRNLKSQ